MIFLLFMVEEGFDVLRTVYHEGHEEHEEKQKQKPGSVLTIIQNKK
jgi:hypothetical protein